MQLLARTFSLLLAAVLVSVTPAAVAAADTSRVVTDHVEVTLLAERDLVAPGDEVTLALHFDIRPDWHTYWSNPGDSGEPPTVSWLLPTGVTAGELQFPVPQRLPFGPLMNYGYSDRVVHLVDLRIPDDWPVGTPLRFAADARWLVCKEECIPESGRLTLSLDTGATRAAPLAERERLFSEARAALPLDLSGSAWIAADAASTLEVEAEFPGPVDHAYFFPANWGLIEHAAEQDWRRTPSGVMLELTPGQLWSTPQHDGLLAVEINDRVIGYRVQPSPQPGAVLDPAAAESTAANIDSLAVAVAFAVVGGMLLNLMPCVFPVLALKALAVVREGAAATRGGRVSSGLWYLAGVLLFFGLVAALLIALRQGGAAIGWGFQLQSPVFVAVMACVFVVIGLALAGVVNLGAGLMSLGSGLASRSGAVGSFWTGALAALVAAPCTAPFMGAALGYALTQPAPVALAVTLSLGLGLALPYLALMAFPGWARWLPSPGAWMETFKQLLAFPMFGTAVWLTWVLSQQAGPSGVLALLSAALLLAFSLWAWERAHGAGAFWGPAQRATAAAAALLAGWLIVGLGPQDEVTLAEQQDAGLVAEPFSPQRLEQLLREGRPVFVNLTAAWCITCKVNERIALRSKRVARAFEAADVAYLVGDWTNRDPQVTALLERYDRSGVPLYLVFRPGAAPDVLPQILTEQIVVRSVSG